VYQLSITRLHTYARLHLVGDAPEVPKRQVPLTNNAQSRVAPGESTPSTKVGRALELDSTVSLWFGLPDSPYLGPGPQLDRVDQQGTLPSLARFVFKTAGGPDQAHTRFQMVNQLGPPLELFGAR